MSEAQAVKLEADWKAALADQFEQPYMQALGRFLREEKAAGKVIYPPGSLIFNALNSTPLAKVKVVIIGQDPYHGPGQAHGLCFSVLPGVPVPPSLQNIFKELQRDLNIEPPGHGCLQAWAEQGVLLLNTVLTVRAGQAHSHAAFGWETFTDCVIRRLAEQREGLVFILWGSHAQKKGAFIDRSRHLVLSAPHPSPLSAHRGFFGSRPFSQTNAYLKAQGKSEIDWQV